MKRLELIIVQFEEVKRLIGIGRVPQLRLALILLDSAVELIMHRMAEAELEFERYPFDRLEKLRRLLRMRQSDVPFNRRMAAAGPSDAQLRAEIQELEETITSKTQRKKIRRDFRAKLDCLVEKNRLPEDLAPVLKKLHDYRNETYHRDQHRVQVIRTAVLIYFAAACTVLDHYRPEMLLDGDPLGPELTSLQGDVADRPEPFELPHRAALQLREEVGLDFAAVRTALVEHLLGRLYDIESGLSHIEENIPSGAIPGDGIRMMQIEEDDMEAVFKKEVLRSRSYSLSMNDIRTWIERATAMHGLDDKHALFAEFAALEDAFEDLEQKVYEAISHIDEEANRR